MDFFTLVLLIALGLLAAPQLVTSRQPEAQGAIDSLNALTPWLGVLSFLWGLYTLIEAILEIGLIWDHFILWLSWLAIAATLAKLGLVVGYPSLRSVVEGRLGELGALTARWHAMLVPFQSVLAIGAVALGLWGILLQLIS